jgi:hypothetical protein
MSPVRANIYEFATHRSGSVRTSARFFAPKVHQKIVVRFTSIHVLVRDRNDHVLAAEIRERNNNRNASAERGDNLVHGSSVRVIQGQVE